VVVSRRRGLVFFDSLDHCLALRALSELIWIRRHDLFYRIFLEECDLCLGQERLQIGEANRPTASSIPTDELTAFNSFDLFYGKIFEAGLAGKVSASFEEGNLFEGFSFFALRAGEVGLGLLLHRLLSALFL
jgi:hypothetical protein